MKNKPAITWNKKSKRWETRVQINGRRYRFASDIPGSDGKKDVELQIKKADSSRLRSVTARVGQVWPLFLEDTLERSSSENLRNVESIGRLYVLPTLSGRVISDLTPNDWQGIINHATGRNGRQLSEKTLKNIRGTISAFWSFCYRCELAPGSTIKLYIPKNRPSYSKQILQPDQIRRLFAEDFPEDFYINCWRLMILTGLRPGEALGLKWSDLDGGTLTINRSINRARKITAGKNKNARRAVPLPSLALSILQDQKLRTEDLASEWIFPNKAGDLPSQSTAFKHFKKTAEALGAPSVSPYGLRHSFISIISLSTPEAVVKRLVGHSVSMDTFKVYGSHSVDGEGSQISAALDNAFKDLKAPTVRRLAAEELPSEPSGVKITRLGS